MRRKLWPTSRDIRSPAEARANDSPIAETLGPITPSNAGSVSVENDFGKKSIIRGRVPGMGFAAGTKTLIRSCLSSHQAWRRVGRPSPGRPPMNDRKCDCRSTEPKGKF
jgi:hypothetical protein